MISLNRAMIVGNLTRDPELRYTPSGQPVCSFGIATNRRWRDKEGNQKEDVQFHDIVAWGKLAEVVSQILKKGTRAYVDGRLQTRQWEGQDGAKRQRTEIVMENFIPLTPKGAGPVEEMAEAAAPSVAEEPVSGAAEAVEESEKKEKKTKKDSEKETSDKKEKVGKDEEEIDLDEIPF